MEPESALRAGEYYGHTTVHALGVSILLALGLVGILVPHRLALLPLILFTCFVSAAQRVVFLSLDFDFLRIMVLFGWGRLLVRNEVRRFPLTSIDWWLLAFATIGAITYAARVATAEAVINRLGWLMDVVGLYFLCRISLARERDPRVIGSTFAQVAVPVAVCFAIEYATSRNIFSVFGGVPGTTWMRDGKLRCQGAFSHPIIAGVFWVTMLPVVASLWWSGGRARTWAAIGSLCILAIVFMTSSSTPAMGGMVALIALWMFPIRRNMRQLRWAVLVVLGVLHMVMNAPVWHLLARANLFDASTGWHRYALIDAAIRHFEDWAVFGTSSTASWGIVDITNEFVLVGVEGGAGALCCYIAMIVCAFHAVGARCARLGRDSPQSRIAWGLGCALFVACACFFAVSNFGQMRVALTITIALIASQGARKPRRQAVPHIDSDGGLDVGLRSRAKPSTVSESVSQCGG